MAKGMGAPEERLRKWVEDMGYSITDAAKQIGIPRSMLSYFTNGKRRPGRRSANKIEHATKAWKDGPIRSVDWDE